MKKCAAGWVVGLSLIAACDVSAAAPRSCEQWQGASEQQLAGQETWSAALVRSDAVQVYAAPDAVCGCPGSELHKSMAVYAYRSFRGFTRVLYIDRTSNLQISGWVRSEQLKRDGKGSAPI